MYGRLIAVSLLWGLRFGLTWLIAHECLTLVIEKFDAVSRALSTSRSTSIFVAFRANRDPAAAVFPNACH
jgi:hypothetical protein